MDAQKTQTGNAEAESLEAFKRDLLDRIESQRYAIMEIHGDMDTQDNFDNTLIQMANIIEAISIVGHNHTLMSMNRDILGMINKHLALIVRETKRRAPAKS